VHSPTDGRLLGAVPNNGAAEVAAAAADLRAAQVDWEDLGPERRARVLLRYRDWILDNQQHLLDIIQAESGKVRQDAAFEPASVADVISYYARNAKRFLADRSLRPHGLLTASKALALRHRPYQLVGHISPWNFPFFIPVGDSAPALLAGAAVLLKPSEVTPLIAVEAGRGWQEIGAPDVFRVVTGDGAAGAAVVDHVDFVQFTGSTRTGRSIAQQAGGRLIPCSLELGGKDPMIVLGDANVERAVNAAMWGGLFNSGQACTSVERIYVEEGVYEQFTSRLVEKVRELRQGPDLVAGESEIGAMATPSQVKLVQQHVDDAVKGGARVLTGGRSGLADGPPAAGGNWYQPTVLVDVDQRSRLMQEETFGPTLPVVKVRDSDEAVRLANDSQFGLSASVWGRDKTRAMSVARRVQAGAVNVNDMYTNISALPLPMAGWGASGLGFRFGGAAGILRFCRPQAITSARLTPKNEPLWYPYSPAKSRAVGRLVRFVVARGRRRFADLGASEAAAR
jgi:betaine-aldehyde dehydrogenase